MNIDDHPAFPRFNELSSGLKQAEDRMLDAIKNGQKTDVASAKIALIAAVDEYRKLVDGIDKDLP